MNRMADGVLKEMDNNQKREDEMIAKYEIQREIKLRKEEEKKAKKKAMEMREMVATLNRQEAEKKEKELAIKKDMN